MNTRIALAAPAVLAALTLAACGASSQPGADKTPDGVKAAYVQMTDLVNHGKGQEACDRYFTPAARMLADGFGGCAKLLEQSGQKTIKASQVKATVNGNTASYQVPGDSGKAVWADGHWRFDVS